MQAGYKPTANKVSQENGKRLLAICILILFSPQKAFRFYMLLHKTSPSGRQNYNLVNITENASIRNIDLYKDSLLLSVNSGQCQN